MNCIKFRSGRSRSGALSIGRDSTSFLLAKSGTTTTTTTTTIRRRILLTSSLVTLASTFSTTVPHSPLGRCYYRPNSRGTCITRQESMPTHFSISSKDCYLGSSTSRCFMVSQSQSSTSQKEKEEEAILAMEEWQDMLPFETGSHNSAKLIIPDRDDDDDDSSLFAGDAFREKLQRTIAACRELDKSSLWVHVPMARASLIESMVQTPGLQFHHASGNVAVLNVWLRDATESKIPEFATHNVGVGAVVVNSRNEILCVRELRKNYMPWKTPTGLTELGESLHEAAVREVMEETGVATSFHSILSFRQTHGHAHGRSDMFFVCRMDPIEEVDHDGNAIIPDPVAQECEIERAAWVPYAEYREMVMHPEQGHPMMQQVLQVLEAKQKIEKTVVTSVLASREPNDLYFPAAELEDRELC